jgi:hypothetical protein
VAKTWNEMTEAEQAEINAQENERESYKADLESSDEPVVSDSDLDEWYARMEERMGGRHHDSLYW